MDDPSGGGGDPKHSFYERRGRKGVTDEGIPTSASFRSGLPPSQYARRVHSRRKSSGAERRSVPARRILGDPESEPAEVEPAVDIQDFSRRVWQGSGRQRSDGAADVIGCAPAPDRGE